MTSDSKAAPPPYSGASEYQLVESADDKYDLALNATSQSGGASYYLHLTRTNDTPHLTIHNGTSDSSAPLAALMYDEFSAGRLHTGDPSAIPSDTKVSKQWTSWTQPPLSNYAEFTLSSPSSGARSFRWHKSYQTERHVFRPSRRYITWVLHTSPSSSTSPPAEPQASSSPDVVEVPTTSSSSSSKPVKPKTETAPTGPALAKLSLLAPAKPTVVRPLNGVAGTEIGQLSWEASSQGMEQATQDAAVLVVAALVHRDRQVGAREAMGPTIKVEMVARPHNYGRSTIGEAGVGAVGMGGGGAGAF